MHVNADSVRVAEERCMPKPSDIEIHALEQGIGALWDFMIRVSGVCLFLLLIVAYATGEEIQHTHGIIGYALVALIIVALWWEIFRSHESRYLDSIFHPPSIRRVFRAAGNAIQSNKATAGLFVMTVVVIVGLMGTVALLLMFLTHNFYPATNVDEMHEVVAYFALGLVALHVVVAAIASAEHFEKRNEARSAKS
jgi:cytochrome b